MAETSFFWTTNGTGDGPADGYTMATFNGFLRRLLTPNLYTTQGVLRAVGNELLVSGSASPLAVASGAGVVDGLFYENTAPVSLAVATPVTGVTGGRVNLKADWTAQTVRAVVQRNTDGVAAIPALVQTDGSEWNIPLATFTINLAGVITLTDARVFCAFASYLGAGSVEDVPGLSVIGRAANTIGVSGAIIAVVDGRVLLRNGNVLEFGQVPAAGIANGAVTADKLASGAVIAGKIGAGAVDATNIANGAVNYNKIANGAVTYEKIYDGAVRDSKIATGAVQADHIAGGAVIADKLASGAVTAGKIASGAVDASKLASGAVTAAKIADNAVTGPKIADGSIGPGELASDSVDDTKVGDRLPQFRRRQGGSSSNWSTPGTTTYTPTAVRMQAGAVAVSMGATDYNASVVVNFPEAFSYIPIIMVGLQVTAGMHPESGRFYVVLIESVSATSVQLSVYRNVYTDGAVAPVVYWLAAGPE